MWGRLPEVQASLLALMEANAPSTLGNATWVAIRCRALRERLVSLGSYPVPEDWLNAQLAYLDRCEGVMSPCRVTALTDGLQPSPSHSKRERPGG